MKPEHVCRACAKRYGQKPDRGLDRACPGLCDVCGATRMVQPVSRMGRFEGWEEQARTLISPHGPLIVPEDNEPGCPRCGTKMETLGEGHVFVARCGVCDYELAWKRDHPRIARIPDPVPDQG